MDIGKELKSLRVRKELSQENIASDMYVDQTLISKFERGTRKASKEFATASVSFYGDAQYGFGVARETAKEYISPLTIANEGIEWHRLALEEVFKKEAEEAIKHFNEVSLVKNPKFATDEEIRLIKEGINELLDVQAIINSFLVKLEQAYPVSVSECMKKRLSTWKAKGWIEI